MKVVCPNDANHKRFSVTAHITEEWIVDENGEFLDVTGNSGEVTHRPGKDDCFTCIECFALAKTSSGKRKRGCTNRAKPCM